MRQDVHQDHIKPTFTYLNANAADCDYMNKLRIQGKKLTQGLLAVPFLETGQVLLFGSGISIPASNSSDV